MSDAEEEEKRSKQRSEAGRKGYLAALAKNPDFHSLGGKAFVERIDMFFCSCHGVGLGAAYAHNKVKGKKHRYRKS
ncbi:MAG: hypothetical protein J0I20_33920 [Chloroflexi bacterium]|nr:hypothetical protein [Chloroflexota bacterium]